MVGKRGRPLSTDTTDPAVLKQRELQRKRVERFRERQRALHAVNQQPSQVAVDQGNLAVTAPLVLEEPAPTLSQLGLRLQNVNIAQDHENIPRENNTVEVREDEGLRRRAGNTPSHTPPIVSPESRIPQTQKLNIPTLFRAQSRSSRHSSSPRPLATVNNQGQTPSPRVPISSRRNSIRSFFSTPSQRSEQTVPTQNQPLNRLSELLAIPQQEDELPLTQISRAQQQEEDDIAAAIAASLKDIETARESTTKAWQEQQEEYPVQQQDDDTRENSEVQGGLDTIIPEEVQLIEYEPPPIPVLSTLLPLVQSLSDSTIPVNGLPTKVVPIAAPSNPIQVPAPSVEDEVDQSEQNGAEEEEEEEQPLVFTVNKLYQQLQTHGFHGCSEEAHVAAQTDHDSSGDNNHYSLDELFNLEDFPSVIKQDTRLNTQELAGETPIPPSTWESIFCGTSPEQDHPRQACLHKEESKLVEPQVANDVDSFLGFASSLDFAQQGIWYQPVPIAKQNIQTDVHVDIETREELDDEDHTIRVTKSPLKNIPHFFLGRIEGALNVTIHILFPHLVPMRKDLNILSEQQLRRWVDHIFNPAIYQFCEPHYLQHLPASFQHAYTESRAAQVETRRVEGQGYGVQQAVAYFLQPEVLTDIWEKVLTKTEEAGYRDFREPQIYFSAKGTKLQFKTTPSRPTLVDSMEHFESYLTRVIDMNFVYQDRLYVDIGKEICARVSRLRGQPGGPEDEAQVYLWKRCCLESYLDWLYDNKPPKSGSSFFQMSMLRDACNMVSQPLLSSRLREGGLVYSQFYGSVKETIDAAKTYPFQNEGLEELALDPHIRKSVDKITGGRRQAFQTIQAGYLASKRRLRISLRDSKGKSFGIREEHRITWALFQALKQRLQQEERDSLQISLTHAPAYVWTIKTETYLKFLRQNADRFATGFEVVAARAHEEFLTWEQTKMLAMFLRCLRFSLAGHQLAAESALWWTKRQAKEGDTNADTQERRIWYGMGFSRTLKRYGYCWLEPRIDWTNLVFRPEVTDNVLFGNTILKRQYLKHGGQVQEFFSTTRRLDLALEWLQQFQNNALVRDRLIDFIIHLCLQQMRIDTINKLPKGHLLPAYIEEAQKGNEPFTYSYITEIFGQPPYLLSGNRSGRILPSSIGKLLFQYNDGNDRQRWDTFPFRTLYRRARTSMTTQFGRDHVDITKPFRRRFWCGLFKFHWILPYPGTGTDGWGNNSKQGQERMWYSSRPIDNGLHLDDMKPSDWEWAKKEYHTADPPRLPEELFWERDRWEEYLALQQPVNIE